MGRAVGWLMYAIIDSLEFIPNENDKAKIEEAFIKIAKDTLDYLRKDGYFSWQLTALEGPKDTSATAMIGYALKKGSNLLDDSNLFSTKNEQQIKKAIINSCRYGKIYDCSDECEGFSQYPQVYGAYPWSLGPATRFLII